MCAACAECMRRSARKRREALPSLGMCMDCGNPLGDEGTKHRCRDCMRRMGGHEKFKPATPRVPYRSVRDAAAEVAATLGRTKFTARDILERLKETEELEKLNYMNVTQALINLERGGLIVKVSKQPLANRNIYRSSAKLNSCLQKKSLRKWP